MVNKIKVILTYLKGVDLADTLNAQANLCALKA